jgi:tight adherence protein C
MSALLPFGIALAWTLACAPVSYALARVAPLPRPEHGPRGLRRRRALHASAGFALAEPVLRWLAALIARALCTPRLARWSAALCAAIERRLVESGNRLGLDPCEQLALSLLGAATGTLFGAGGRALELGGWLPLPFALLGAGLPWLALFEAAKRRKHSVTRRLPTAIDLLALCMDAGLDFAGALELVARELTRPDEPLGEELQRIQQELATGRTRREALAAFAERVPSPAVRDFAASVAQSEQKGNPLAETLEVQAQMLRMRRSVSAEEAAARASVLLILPVIVLMCAILLVLFGPFIVEGVELS